MATAHATTGAAVVRAQSLRLSKFDNDAAFLREKRAYEPPESVHGHRRPCTSNKPTGDTNPLPASARAIGCLIKGSGVMERITGKWKGVARLMEERIVDEELVDHRNSHSLGEL
ncbi:hypothetical protein EVAR_6602_1 [Eumeta japonica]|uniref:Uncharacterized protein n=1 Tax=Eumeta variegata TaxID=151549 RepID=A0A4C1TN92_EUMVA|nr:hypothetical protein EVAR_6602_1 [Eumeta japonica]